MAERLLKAGAGDILANAREGGDPNAGRLAGRRVVVTRAGHQAGDTVELLRTMGAEPVEIPTIEIRPTTDWGPVDLALERIGEYDAVVLTSVNVAGFGDAGPQVALAAAVLGPPKPDEPVIRFAIDANLFDSDLEKRYLEDLFIPGILKAGGLRNAVALIAPRPLLLYNTHALFDASWAEAAYQAVGSQLIVSRSRKSPAEVVRFLIAGPSAP